jgi:Tfp pilus assembly protein PilF
MNNCVFMIVFLFTISGLLGCSASSPDPKTAVRRPDVALEELARGTKLFKEGDLAKAEHHLLKAMEADAFSGMAHNNLGLVYYHQGRLYDAAWQFQCAGRRAE